MISHLTITPTVINSLYATKKVRKKVRFVRYEKVRISAVSYIEFSPFIFTLKFLLGRRQQVSYIF